MKCWMLKNNPDGYTPEQILEGLIDDLMEQQAEITTKLGLKQKPSDKELTAVMLSALPEQRVLAVLYCNNKRSIAGLQEALQAQHDSMRLLDGFGKADGSLNDPVLMECN